VWEPYRDAFGLRSTKPYAGTIRAADEVVWACFEPFAQSQAGVRRSMPLPTFANVGPRVYTRQDTILVAPRSLPPELFAKARETIEELPIPLMELPPISLYSPWKLAVIAHEVGHVVQRDWEPAQKYVSVFSQFLLENAETARPGTGAKWANWCEEVFADTFSVFLLGPAAVMTLFGVLYDDPEQMDKELNSQYPPASVRLRLAQGVASALGIGASSAGLLGAATSVGLHLDVADRQAAEIAKLTSGPLAKVRYPAADFLPAEDARAAMNALSKPPPTGLSPGTRSVRMVLAGACEASDGMSEEKLEAFAARTVESLLDCAPPGTRAGAADLAPNHSILDTLRSMDKELWEV
jgi:hypothetical protein